MSQGMIPGEGSKKLMQLRPFSSLHEECDEQDHIEHAIAMALSDLWMCEGINPVRIAALALEDANYHKDAKVLFDLDQQMSTR